MNELIKLAAAAVLYKDYMKQNPYLPLMQDWLNKPAMDGLDKMLGRHQEKQVEPTHDKYDGIRSRLKSIFNSLPSGGK